MFKYEKMETKHEKKETLKKVYLFFLIIYNNYSLLTILIIGLQIILSYLIRK